MPIVQAATRSIVRLVGDCTSKPEATSLRERLHFSQHPSQPSSENLKYIPNVLNLGQTTFCSECTMALRLRHGDARAFHVHARIKCLGRQIRAHHFPTAQLSRINNKSLIILTQNLVCQINVSELLLFSNLLGFRIGREHLYLGLSCTKRPEETVVSCI